MFNPSSVVIGAFLEELVGEYIDMFGNDDDDIQLLSTIARDALEIISNSDAPYHDTNHTILVTLVGIQVMRGKVMIEGKVSTSDWLSFIISLLHHDIGYCRGICKADRNGQYAINEDGDTVSIPAGATDAFLTPYHIERAKLFISHKFKAAKSYGENINVDQICANIERTRFPVPAEHDHQESGDMPGLLRAADLIGQLADPQYMRKISSLFYEFKEAGTASSMGYTTAADVQSEYPKFFWEVVSPYIQEGLRYLARTQEGQQWVANLYANVFTEEHEIHAFGPERRISEDRRNEPDNLFQAAETSANDLRKKGRRTADID